MATLRLSLAELLYRREFLKLELEAKLPEESATRARNDYHARKPPRPCGFTVHSVLGCTFACNYCYLPDMGISFSSASPYGLRGEEITYALLSNSYFLPGRLGSLIAVGSVGEPFVDEKGSRKTLEYLAAFSKYLGNPVQFSTKALLSEEHVRALAAMKLPLSPLVTVISLQNHKVLEPHAPSPEERFLTIKRLRQSGLKPILFLRPLIPGVNLDDVEDIIVEAKNSGAVGVVVGGFRATATNLTRLKKLGVNLSEVEARIKKPPQRGEQVPLSMEDLKRKVLNVAREKGLVPFLSACCANNFTAYLRDSLRAPCPGLDFIEGKFCTECPVGCPRQKTEVDPEEVKSVVKRFTGGGELEVTVDDRYIVLSRLMKRKLKPVHKHLLEVGYRRRVLFR